MNTKKKKFTLIELLIVISIIAILASLLLPALNRARETAYKSDCMARMKQIALGSIMLYSDNYAGWCPSADYSYFFGNGNYWPWWRVLYHANFINYVPGALDGNWAKRMGRKAILHCPAVYGNVFFDQSLDIGIYSNLCNPLSGSISWTYTKAVTANNGTFGGYFKPSTVMAPSRLPLLSDTNDYSTGKYYGNGRGSFGPYMMTGYAIAYNHFQSANMAFVDGHAETVKKTVIGGSSWPNFKGL